MTFYYKKPIERIELVAKPDDVTGLLSNYKVTFSLGEIKSVIKQLLDGLYHIHCNKIIHRDMKAANVLITR